MVRLIDKLLLGAWNIGIVESAVEDVFNEPSSMKIRWMRHKYRDRYFADPFLEDQDGRYYYIAAEEYLFPKSKGRISRLTVDKKTMRLVQKETLLNDDHHLSYPFLLNGCIIPEGYRSGATYAYEKVSHGEKYRRFKLSDEALIDPTILQYDGRLWLFATTKETTEDALARLSIFYSDQLGAFKPHAMNPVKVDFRNARPGGRFFEYQGRLFRPAMDNEKSYGYGIRIMEVKKLTTNVYEEHEVLALPVKHSPPYELGLHTFNVYDNCIVVDGYREYRSYFLKPCLAKFDKILTFLYSKFEAQGKEIISDMGI